MSALDFDYTPEDVFDPMDWLMGYTEHPFVDYVDEDYPRD